MKTFVTVVATVLLFFLQTGPGWAQQEKGNADRIRQLEEELTKIRKEVEAVKTDQQATKSARERAKLPITFGASVTIRYDSTEVEDQADLLQDENEINGLRTRVRVSAEYNLQGSVGAGVRLSTGASPNPAAPFIRLGDAFRAKSFDLDQFYIVARPLKFFDTPPQPLKAFEDLSFTFGKMPLPFWRGDRGTWRSELVWDDDINPEGALFRIRIPTGLALLEIENVLGYFLVNEVTDTRFTGLTGDTFLVADQLRFRVDKVTLAAALYNYNRLNAGLRAPSFFPGVGGFVSPGTSALLMREGLQTTNNRVNFGPGAEGFVKEDFTFVNLIAQAYLPLPAWWLEPLGLAPLEVFATGDYTKNTSLARDSVGHGITGGLRGGDKGILAPFNIWATYRNVDADAAIAAFADSDLGAGTAYRGFEVGVNYRLRPNLLLQFSYFDFDGFPRKDNNVSRWFVDLVWTY